MKHEVIRRVICDTVTGVITGTVDDAAYNYAYRWICLDIRGVVWSAVDNAVDIAIRDYYET